MKQQQFDNQVIIITGAGGAIGAEYARYLAARGAKIIVNDIHSADKVVAEITAAGGQAVADNHDVVNQADLIINTALNSFGHIDTVINNAGVWDDAKIYDIPPDSFNRTLDIHLLGTLNVSRAAWPHLAKTKGRLIQTASASIFGGSKTTAYPIAKGGIFASVNALKRTADEDGISINGVLPIAFSQMVEMAVPDSPQKDLLRQMLPAHIAAFVALLSHPSVPFSGMCFDVCGEHVSRIMYAHNEGVYGTTLDDFLRQATALTRENSLGFCGDSTAYTQWKLNKAATNRDTL